MSESKPCPFCGTHKAKVVPAIPNVYYSGKNRYRVYCYECHAVSDLFKTEQEAIDAWNRRPEPHKYTVEEMQEMYGQPVWYVREGEEHGWWRLLGGQNLSLQYFLQGSSCSLLKDYNKAWVAYDRPLEEESK